MANRLRRKLAKLVGEDLTYNVRGSNLTGTWMYIQDPESEENKHFFVPYNKSRPFRVSLSSGKVIQDKERDLVYATDSELKELANFEMWLALADPAAEINGRAGQRIIRPPVNEQSYNNRQRFMPGFSMGF